MHDLGRQFDAIAVALGIARRCGAPVALLAAAEGALEELAVIAGMADPRRVATFQRGLRIERLRSKGHSRRQIREKLSVSADQYDRAILAVRVAYDHAEFQLESFMDLKSVSLGIGSGIAKPIGAYGSAARPNPPKDATPRDGGGMSTGETAGNYKQDLSKIGVNGTGVAAAAAESAQATMEGNGQ